MTKAVEFRPSDGAVIESGKHVWKQESKGLWRSPDGKRSRGLVDWLACGGAGWME